jgi:hypothetical protein
LNKAIFLIRAHGWSVAELVEDYAISREDYLAKQEPVGLQYCEQALVDGEVLVFFVPKGN